MRRLLTRLVPLLAFTAGAALAAGEEVPFITSPDNVTQEMLRIAKVAAADHVIDLGSGDGRIVILAAKRFGASGLGVEIDPNLVKLSNRHAREAGVAERAVFKEQDLFKTDLSKATVVTMYLLPEVNLQLRPSLLALKAGTRVVSHDWDMGDWKPDQTSVLPVPDKKVGLDKSSKVHLWVVPAKVQGLWCGNGPLHEFSLRMTQHYQKLEGTLTRKARVRQLEGTIDGNVIRAEHKNGAMVLTAAGDELRITDGSGALALLRGQTFRRTTNENCASSA